MNKFRIRLVHRLYILSAVVLGIVGSAILLGIVPAYTNITTLTEDIHEKRVQLAIYNQERSNLEQTRRDYNTVKNDISEIGAIFVNNEQVLDVLSTLENIAQVHTLQQSITVVSTPDKNAEKKLSLRVILTGSWDNSINYLKDVEQLSYYVRIGDPVLSKTNDGISFTFNAETYGEK